MKINKWLLITLCSLLFICILLIAYLLGKQSSNNNIGSFEKKSENNITAKQSDVKQEDTTDKNQSKLEIKFSDGENSGNLTIKTKPLDLNLNNTVNSEQNNNKGPGRSNSDNIRSYFSNMDNMGSMDFLSGNAQELAVSIVQNSMNDNYSDIDNIISKCQDIKNKISQITPPAECGEFHRQMLSCMDEMINLYQNFKRSFQNHDTSSLNSISERAQSLRNKLDALEREKKNILSGLNN